MASTLEDRAAARRAALIEAGVELLGTEGAAGVTVRAVCRGARLTERYFYEAFPDGGRDALLRAVHAQVAGEAREAIVAAVARAARATAEALALRGGRRLHGVPGGGPAPRARAAQRVVPRDACSPATTSSWSRPSRRCSSRRSARCPTRPTTSTPS